MFSTTVMALPFEEFFGSCSKHCEVCLLCVCVVCVSVLNIRTHPHTTQHAQSGGADESRERAEVAGHVRKVGCVDGAQETQGQSESEIFICHGSFPSLIPLTISPTHTHTPIKSHTYIVTHL